MDIYNQIAEWTGWPALFALVLVGLTILDRIKSNVINLLREKNKTLEDKVDELESFSPDVLAQRLAERVKILSSQLESLNSDHDANKNLIKEKEAELEEIKKRIKRYHIALENAKERLDEIRIAGLFCPKCGALLERREAHQVFMEIDGRDLEADIEVVSYQCGYSTIDGREDGPCRNSP